MKFFASKRTGRLLNFSLAALLVMSTLTASVPFLFSQNVDAAPGVSYTSMALSQSDWTVDRSVPSGGWTVDTANQRVTLNVNQSQANTTAPFYQTEGVVKALPAGTDTIKADLYVASDWNTKPSLRVGLWGVTQDAGNTGLSYPIIEYVNIGGYTGWRVWNANDGSWNNVVASTNVGGQNTVEIVSSKSIGASGTYDFYVNNNKVYTYSADDYTTFTSMILNNYNLGTGVASDNYSVVWNNFKTGTLPVVAACAATSTFETSYMGNWNLSETRTTGHNELVTNGLHVYTEGATSTDKAAAYYTTDFALQNAGFPSMDFAATNTAVTNQQPGLQMVVDFDNDGSADGILVGEAVYGNDWWASGSTKSFVTAAAPLHTGGSGSSNHGTLNGWLEAFPTARVKAIGYSMGSGVYGDGIISSLVFGCVNYTFTTDTTAPSKPVLALPSNGSTLPTNDFDFDWNDSTDVNPITYEFHSSQDPSRDASGVLNGSGIWTSGILPTSNIHSSGAPDGYWFYQVRAKDAAGNYSPWSDIWSVVIDTKAPTAPVITYPSGWHQDVTNIEWNASEDTSAVTYSIYEGSHPSDVNVLIAQNLTGTSFAHTFATGPHQIRVVAKDALGRTTSSETVGFQVIGTPQIILPTQGLVLNASNGSSYTASWTAAYGVGGTKNYEVEYGIDSNGDGIIQSSELQYRTVSGTALERTQSFSTNFQGVMTIRVRAVYNFPIGGTDKGPWSTLVNYSRDSIKPAAPTVTASGIASGASTNQSSVNILWNTPSTDTVKYDYRVWTNAAGSAFNSEATAYYEYNLTGNSRSGAFSEGQGTYFVQVRAIDAAGNTSDWSNTFAVTYDTIAPAVQIDTPANGTTFGNNSIIAVTGSTGDSVSYTLTIGIAGQVPIVSQGGASFSSYNWDTVGLASGDYTITLTATDAAGNTSDPVSVVITIDNSAPVITIAPQASTAGNQPTITGTVNDVNAALLATFNGAEFIVTNSGGAYSFTAPAALANGTYSFSIQATDVNGNVSSQTANVIVAVAPADSTPATTVTPIITSPAADSAVLGTNTQATADNEAVKGATDASNTIAAAAKSAANQGTIFGLAWYWWILILGALAGLAWFIAAAIRRRNEEQI